MKMSQKFLIPTLLAAGFVAGATPLAGQASSDVPFGQQDPGQRLTGSVDLQGGFDDNVYATHTNEQDSFFSRVAGRLNYRLGDSRTTLNLGLSSSGTYFYDRDDDPWDLYVNGTASFFHNLSERVNLFGNTTLTYAAEPDFGTVITSDRRNGDYFVSNTSGGFSFQWTERFSTVSRANFTSVFYEDDVIGDFYNRIEFGGSQSFRFKVLPDTTAVLEYRISQISHEDSSRDALSQHVLAGVDHSFTSRLSGTLRAGAEFRDYESIGMKTSPFLESRVTYLLPRSASLSWNARYGFEVSDTLNAEERRTFRTSLAYNQRITGKLKGSIAASYSHSEYSREAGSDFNDDIFGVSASLSYAITSNLALTAGYTFQLADSDIFTREYDRNRYTLGVQVAF